MIFVLDNFDSFTYNIVQCVASLGVSVEVARNRSLTPEQILAMRPDGIIISPGPGRPEDAGMSVPLILACADAHVPMLGICLGHQALAVAFGAEVVRAPALMHGKTSLIRHEGDGIFAGLPNPLRATRYHSLVVNADSLPDELVATAVAADDGVLMGIRHRSLPLEGLQFHPESILTPDGPALLQHFLGRCAVHA